MKTMYHDNKAYSVDFHIEDVGIGQYEYWGEVGYDSQDAVVITEVLLDGVSVYDDIPEDVLERWSNEIMEEYLAEDE